MISSTSAKARNRTILLRFIFPTICASLGTWQIIRWQQKQKVLKEMEIKIASKAKLLEEADEDFMSKFKIFPVSSGKRALLGPRGLGPPLGYGYTLFEKAKLPNGDTIVLNRGNFSLDNVKDPIQKLEEELIVVQDKEERKPLFGRENTSDRILWKDWRVLKESLEIDPEERVSFFKVLKKSIDPNIQGKEKQVLHGHELSLDQIPNRHLEYIATWYSLAAFSLIMSFIRK